MKAWIEALRPRTLPLALSSIAMGSFLAVAYNVFNTVICILALLTTALLQMLSNLANDYGDFQHGADSDEREGPSRMVQSGAISAEQMRNAIILFTLLCLITGILLLYLAFNNNWEKFIPFLVLGVISIVAAIAYTMGVRPYGYAGLGDISVFLFFGMVGVGGSFYLFSQNWSNDILLPAVSCGTFSVAVLNINNIRDIKSDEKAGKYSIPVRIGKKKAVAYHWILLMAGVISAVLFTILNYESVWQWLFLISIPALYYNGKKVSELPSEKLDPYLKQMALSTLLFVITFGTGLIIA